MHTSNLFTLGASTIKWTIMDPWIGLSDSHSTLYVDFEFLEVKNHEHQKKYQLTKPRKLYWQKKFQEKSTYYSKHAASGVQIGNFEQVTV